MAMSPHGEQLDLVEDSAEQLLPGDPQKNRIFLPQSQNHAWAFGRGSSSV